MYIMSFLRKYVSANWPSDGRRVGELVALARDVALEIDLDLDAVRVQVRGVFLAAVAQICGERVVGADRPVRAAAACRQAPRSSNSCRDVPHARGSSKPRASRSMPTRDQRLATIEVAGRSATDDDCRHLGKRCGPASLDIQGGGCESASCCGSAGWVEPTSLDRAIAEQRHTGKRLCSLLVARGLLDPDDAARALGAQHGVAGRAAAPPRAPRSQARRADPARARAIAAARCRSGAAAAAS